MRILQRASLSTLLLVPALAYAWNWMREYISSVVDSLANVEILISDEGALRHSKCLAGLIFEIQSEVAILRNMSFSSEPMPWSWAAAFFAALAVLLGNTIYQITAPTEVKTEGEREYVERRVSTYAALPSQDVLEEAEEILSGVGKYELTNKFRKSIEQIFLRVSAMKGMSRKQYIKNLSPVQKLELREYVEEYQEGITPEDDLLETIDACAPPAQSDQVLHDYNLLKVERAARAQYQRFAAHAKFAIWVCASLYGVAAVLVVLIMMRQCKNVAMAAGWLKV